MSPKTETQVEAAIDFVRSDRYFEGETMSFDDVIKRFKLNDECAQVIEQLAEILENKYGLDADRAISAAMHMTMQHVGEALPRIEKVRALIQKAGS